jgi:hypothetical protein
MNAKNEGCPIGPLRLHTLNYERDECIWCGPRRLAWQPGKWVDLDDGLNAWSAEPGDGAA